MFNAWISGISWWQINLLHIVWSKLRLKIEIMGNNMLKITAVTLCSLVFGLGTVESQVNHRGNSNRNNQQQVTGRGQVNNNARQTKPSPSGSNMIGNNKNSSSYKNNNKGVPASGSNNVNRPSAGIHRPQNPMKPNGNERFDGGAKANGISRPNYVAGVHVQPPVRQNRPKTIGAPRPIVKPSNYVNRRNEVYINNVLGLAFFSNISYSLSYLYDNRFYIDGYTDNTIYLRDVVQLDCSWEDVLLNYTNSGLNNAQFIYSTAGNSESRYNQVYRRLCAMYGDPVMFDYNVRSPKGTAAWFGRDNLNYVTLEYYYDYATNGQRRYYTVLTYCSNARQ